ncbi:hypothetical protein TBLA_0B01140 [Henningerozyma blattae CBS 6284]|uniref:Small ribosomal subunit protein uS4m n=1 Tax=Henningerozyma blattae (strain ATCC 34711 / CBS 6284 / DSM 70876 / NBRC 10599 / NRRL Y-10934 / UCD 77-7) TaxID=1071380 RepID=I2GXV5_HENB6|nr:hypothetical protein TBLA_0B01140 [Tetrapisispora blattae CBS 6284]CCH58957.1 hypothetical protein TBLA_0B01140 [Tetrapisispora blattae CBS 6284]
MPKKAILLKSLTRGRVRTSFNKYNLFNLYKKNRIDFKSKSLYQQKFISKQETRAYHGEHLTEGRWKATFTPALESVAQLDASLRGGKVPDTPYLLQTYGVLEKRLDFALFRAMFASSVRQARQFILHGNVTVNGIKIKHPGYVLKPGDLFHVTPEKVLMALGAKKPNLEEALKVDKIQIVLWNKYVKNARENPKKVWDVKMKKLLNLPNSDPKKQKYLEFVKNYEKSMEARLKKELTDCTPSKILTNVIEHIINKDKEIEKITEDDFSDLYDDNVELKKTSLAIMKEFKTSDNDLYKQFVSKTDEERAKFIEELLALRDPIKETIKAEQIKTLRQIKFHLSTMTKPLNSFLLNKYSVDKLKSGTDNSTNASIPYNPSWSKKLKYHDPIKNVKELIETNSSDENKLKNLINLPWQQKAIFGREEKNKSYFTPWKPRPFLSPFAILPHHIEISFKTCSAIYLNDPKARPGHSEVISPFNLAVHERAYMYYVRKGR